MASTYIYRTPSSTGSNTISTLSAWLKKTVNGSYEGIFTSVYETGEYFQINFEPSDRLEVRCKVSSSYVLRKITNRVFRDTNAWVHIVVAIDTTDSTAEDRVKIYVNGTRETVFDTNTNPGSSQNLTLNTAGSYQHRIGRDEWSTPAYFDGYMAHVHWVDGTVYQASTFGETDSTSGIWKAKTSPTVTYGTNGFFFKFENSGNLDLDSSGNNLTFTTGGTLTQAIDTPSNNFATANALVQPDPSNGTFSTTNGGNKFTTNFTSKSIAGYSSLGMSSGKYYAECKYISGNAAIFGAVTEDYVASGSSFSIDNNDWGVEKGTKVNYGGSNNASWHGDWSPNDILGCAIDLDTGNGRITWSKNGQWCDGSGNWDESSPTAWLDLTADKTYFFAAGDKSTSTNAQWEFNFGNGVFGSTVVSSAGTSPSQGGVFEYDCPSGFQALCTKGINSF